MDSNCKFANTCTLFMKLNYVGKLLVSHSKIVYSSWLNTCISGYVVLELCSYHMALLTEFLNWINGSVMASIWTSGTRSKLDLCDESVSQLMIGWLYLVQNQLLRYFRLIYLSVFHSTLWHLFLICWFYWHTVKPFNLAALKVGDLAFKIILAPFILAN